MSDARDGGSHGDRMQVWIYKGSKRAGAYLFLPGPGDFARVPRALLDVMGRLELVMELELHPRRRLAREKATTVMANLRRRGYHLQMPPVDIAGPGRIH